MLRSRWYSSLLVDAAIIGLIFLAATAWQQRDLLATSVAAPQFSLASMDGITYQLGVAETPQTLVYFFAPWCNVCHASIDNVESIRQRRTAEDLAIYVVALDYQSRAEVEAFLDRHDLSVPVLLGNRAVQQAWQIGAYPTYYVLDADGHIAHRSVGYSTELGLHLRL